MEHLYKDNLLMKTGAALILLGTLSIFTDNGTRIHTVLQITFVAGCILFVLGGWLLKKEKNQQQTNH
jgi:protein-S-isoprenylcysteine O-methyltransferase Ste14